MLDSLKRLLGAPAPGDAQGFFEQALRLAAAGDPGSAASAYREALRCRPDHPEACCNLGLLLVDLGQPEEGEALLRRAVELAPGSADIAANLRMLLSRKAPAWQFPMMNDAARNAAYEKAIALAVRPGDEVLEIGTGSGLLAMMAARAGARRVTTCELLQPLADKAREIISSNGLGDVVSVLPLASNALTIPGELPQPADVLISEIVASDLIGEGMLGSFEDAAARLLKPGARVVPARAWILGQLAGDREIERHLRVGRVSGFDLSGFNEFAPAMLYPDDLGVAMEALSEPFELFAFDFTRRRAFPGERKELSVTATRDGACHGVLQWIRLELFDGVVVENGPPPPADDLGKGHWKRMLHAFAEPVQLRAGQAFAFIAAHNRRNLVVYPAGK